MTDHRHTTTTDQTTEQRSCTTTADRHTADTEQRLALAWADYHEDYDEDDGILTDGRLADLLDTYGRLVADGYDEDSAIDEAVAIVADAQ